MIQQATVDYVNDPGPVNALILELNDQYDTGWVYSEGVADFSVEQQVELGLVGNGPNDTMRSGVERHGRRRLGWSNGVEVAGPRAPTVRWF